MSARVALGCCFGAAGVGTWSSGARRFRLWNCRLRQRRGCGRRLARQKRKAGPRRKLRLTGNVLVTATGLGFPQLRLRQATLLLLLVVPRERAQSLMRLRLAALRQAERLALTVAMPEFLVLALTRGVLG